MPKAVGVKSNHYGVNGVQAAVRWVEDFGRLATFVSVCVGGTGFEVRLPGAVRPAGLGAQFQSGTLCILETR